MKWLASDSEYKDETISRTNELIELTFLFDSGATISFFRAKVNLNLFQLATKEIVSRFGQRNQKIVTFELLCDRAKQTTRFAKSISSRDLIFNRVVTKEA